MNYTYIWNIRYLSESSQWNANTPTHPIGSFHISIPNLYQKSRNSPMTIAEETVLWYFSSTLSAHAQQTYLQRNILPWNFFVKLTIKTDGYELSHVFQQTTFSWNKKKIKIAWKLFFILILQDFLRKAEPSTVHIKIVAKIYILQLSIFFNPKTESSQSRIRIRNWKCDQLYEEVVS